MYPNNDQEDSSRSKGELGVWDAAVILCEV